ncbi:hypothetical protein KIPB_013475 [Kipferlia bialata]|uniref:Uncharacterized protein n=1 Tax=Kipferlia bialata TaxID=797122 RepID=A0A9K3D8M2_9EUKA|nr:hypothetical protein KIPB_013475 [Kipferlia bialata]|eukprot:g13475.t1
MPNQSLAHLDGTFYGATGPTSDTVFSPWSLLHTLLILGKTISPTQQAALYAALHLSPASVGSDAPRVLAQVGADKGRPLSMCVSPI